MNKKIYEEKSKLKRTLFVATTVLTAGAMLFATACSDDTEDDTTSETTKRDTQVIRNGNFEFYNNGSDDQYLISSPDSWSKGSKGTSSYTMSGVIGTSKTAWAALTDDELAEKLDYNNELDSDDEDYEDKHVDYNGMHSYDIPYTNTQAAIDKTGDDYEAVIENPGTHYQITTRDGKNYYTDANGVEKQVYLNTEDGDYYLDSEFKTPMENSVLMVHNYLNTRNTTDNTKKSKFGTEQYYSSSTSITLEANTAAEISVWVKTSNLYYGANGQLTESTQGRGAYIQVSQTVAGNALDAFYISNINTEELVNEGIENSNGWINYTVYVQGCDYASTTLTVSLGLGKQDSYANVEGYAFFDDVVCTKYKNIDDTSISTSGIKQDYQHKYLDKENGGSTCTLLSDADGKNFVASKYVYSTELGDKTYENNYLDTKYFIDLASESERIRPSINVVAGLTVDEDKYASSDSVPAIVGASSSSLDSDVKTPAGVNKATANDLLAYIPVGAHNNWVTNLKSALGENAYRNSIIDEYLDEALSTASLLPGATEQEDTVIMVSTEGAAYTATLSNTEFKVAQDSYKIISFWVKTSNMNSRTAATIKVIDADDKDNNSSFTVDTTGLTTNIGTKDEEKDIFNGWAQCFVFVSNDSSEEKRFTIDFSFGNTTIKGTTSSSYSYGWAAMTNLTVTEVTADEFSYATESVRSATLTFYDETETERTSFDSVYGSQVINIKNQLATPANYKGVNGGSANVIQGVTETSEYNLANKNDFAGLLNKKYIQNYIDNTADGNWLDKVLKTKYTSYNKAVLNASDVWNEVFGASCYQPLLIVNTLRTFYTENASLNEDAFSAGTYYTYENGTYQLATTFDANKTYYSFNKQGMNYGYIGSNKTISSGSTLAVSVKVKASKNAIAYVYLIDDSKQVMQFSLPEYTFWYDDEGNVLKTKPDTDNDNYSTVENIAYKLRSDGLYQNSEGKLFANFYNLKKQYHNEHETYYTYDGTQVNYDNLVEGETYYTDATHTVYSDHYLVTTDGDRVYSYKSGIGEASQYYYFVDGVVNKNYVVSGFDTDYAERRYADLQSKELFYKIDTIANPELADKWITVNFFINGGTESKSYRLELWSGAREEEITAGVEEGSYVMFDYSYDTISSDSFTSLSTEYVNAIRTAYIKAIAEYNKTSVDKITLTSNTMSINELEELVEGKISVDTVYDYAVQYYTFSLYDSANYYPFNKDTADTGETGYKYDISSYDEKLAYLSINDLYEGSDVKEDANLTTFVDYSASEQTVEVGRIEDSEDDDEEDNTDNETNVWLLVASILLVVAIIITLLSIVIRDIIKRIKFKKSGKGTNSYAINKRYVKKYTKANGEVETKDEPKTEDNESSETNEE